VRPERFELPTLWFVEDGPRRISNLHQAAPNGQLWPKSLQGKRFWLFAAACSHSRPSAAKLDFGHTKIAFGVEAGR
jgi:hypothetical protein